MFHQQKNVDSSNQICSCLLTNIGTSIAIYIYIYIYIIIYIYLYLYMDLNGWKGSRTDACVLLKMALSYEFGDLAHQHLGTWPHWWFTTGSRTNNHGEDNQRTIQSCGSTQSIKITNLPRNGFNVYVSIWLFNHDVANKKRVYYDWNHWDFTNKNIKTISQIRELATKKHTISPTSTIEP